MSATAAEMDRELKARHRTMWGLGNYTRRQCRDPGCPVGAEVTASDLSPELLARGKAMAKVSIKRRDRTVSRPAAVAGYVGVVVLMSAGAATGLSGSNTVYSDDIVDKSVTVADLGTNSVSRAKLQDNVVSGSEVIDGSLTGAEVRDGSIARPDVGFNVISGVTKVSQVHQVDANQTGTFTVVCPDSAPVVLGGGYEWSNALGFSASTSEPWYVDGQPNGWYVGGTNGLPQAKNLYVIAICASDGSSS